jgi:mannosylglycerate hydrolase
MTPTYHIVSHSHWDREWYKSFEQFRSMLVTMVDDLLELLRRDPAYRCFTLDGQTSVLDDYLAVRPERRDEIRSYVKKGRIVTGPWYILPDEFLVSAEATVRNLMLGLRMAREFGGTMNVGYIPDSFGHIAMMPSILRGFGIDTALVYRGFGGEPGQTSSEYWWTAPDGTRALLIHLFRHGYSAGYFHQETDEQVRGRFADIKKELDARAATSHRLLMNGGDHHWPDPKLPATLAMLRDSFDGRFEHSTVQRYADAVRREVRALPEIEGELRFGYRYAFAVLGGVYSSRMYIKQANWHAQKLFERYAEPLNAMAVARGGRSRLPLLHHGWKTLLQNHPHDSICGCSIDPVHREMMTRFAAAEEIGASVAESCLEQLVPYDDLAVRDDQALAFFNPSPFPRTEVVPAEVRFYLQDVVVGLNPDVVLDPKLPPAEGFALVDGDGKDVPYQILERSEGYDITYTKYNYPRQTYADKFSLLVRAADVPAVGLKSLRVERRKKFPRFPRTVESGASFLENEYLRVEVGARGTLTVTDRGTGEKFRGLLLFEDGGDVGDEYNYSYPAKDRVVTSPGGSIRVVRVERGPLRAALRVDVPIVIPASATPDRKGRSAKTVTMKVSTTISLSAGSRAVECVTTLDNAACDHRFRVLFPSGIPTDRVAADSQFCVVERQQKEYDVREFTIEHPAQVAPMQRFVQVRGQARSLTVLAYGLPEYELLVDGRGTLALTLLRCVGLLGGDDLITRPGGKAGWHNETPDAQCPGRHTFRYAILPGGPADGPDGELVTSESERFHLPLLPVRRKNEVAVSGSMLSVSDPAVTLSAFKEAEDGRGVIVRLYTTGDAPARPVVTFGFPIAEAHEVKLNETAIRPLAVRDERAVACDVPPRGMVTLRVVPEKP